jgi:hypothetical protein
MLMIYWISFVVVEHGQCGITKLEPREIRERSSIVMKRPTTLSTTVTLLVILAAALSVACGGGEPAPPPSPAAASPSVPTATAIPAAPDPEQGGPPSPYIKYSDPSGAFSIEYPADWTKDDRSRPDTVSIFWYPEDQYAAASLFLTTLAGIPDPQSRIHDLIDEWMVDASAFATDPDYEELSREDQNDGSVLLRFYYTRDGEPAQAGCFFGIQDSFFSALCLSAAQDRWDEMAGVLSYMATSYELAAAAQGQDTGGYAEYVHPSGVFSLEYPDDWTVEDLSTEGDSIFVSLSAETGAFVFAQLVEAPEILAAQGMDAYVTGVLGAGFGQAPEFQEVSRQAQPNGGVLVLYSYLADGETMNAGTLFEQRGSLVSAFTVGAPSQVFNNHTNDFDHAGNSYTIDETAWPY